MYPMSLYESGESSGEISLLDLFWRKEMDFIESKLTIDGLIHSICRGRWPRALLNKTTIFFDEIQHVSGFEKTINCFKVLLLV